MEEKLKRRKLEALKRGVHRVPAGETLPVSTHVVAIGPAGIAVVAEILRSLPEGGSTFHALAIDIGNKHLPALQDLAASLPAGRAELTVVALDPPDENLGGALERYPDFLKLEYPFHVWGAGYEPWLSPHELAPGQVSRAVAKAVCGAAYYAGARTLERTLRDFAAKVEAVQGRTQAVVPMVFGLGDNTGSGIVVDLARHLSTKMFGRRVLVAGIGIAPCAGDPAAAQGGPVFAVMNELDCLNDEAKNAGIVASCGELFRNPFTAGFIVAPTAHVWAATHDLAATHRRVNQEIAALLTSKGGAGLLETLRLLNWIAAPSTQHSAARTPWGARWVHVLGYADIAGPVSADPAAMGLLPGFKPEFVEARVAEVAGAEAAAAAINAAFDPDLPAQLVEGGRAGSVQFMLPSLGKTQFGFFYEARDAYDREPLDQRRLDHSMLLEQGVLVSEPSTRLDGMAGASIGGSACWIAVPLDELRGGKHPLRSPHGLLDALPLFTRVKEDRNAAGLVHSRSKIRRGFQGSDHHRRQVPASFVRR